VVTIRTAVTDADLEHVRDVRMAVVPYERAPTVEQIRQAARPGQLALLAELDGAVVGSGYAGPSNLTGGASVTPRVLPAARRQGVGTALLRALITHAATLDRDFLVGNADDEGSKAFAERFGFVEVDRQVEQVRAIGAVEPWPAPPSGYAIVTVAERPELWDRAYEGVGAQAFQDMAVITPIEVTLAQWRHDWMTDPAAMYVAVAGDEVIGVAGLLVDQDEPHRAENALTAVRRDWRGRGVAATLKRTTLAWAAEHGLTEVYTWTQKGNADMRRLNEHLGYTTRLQSFTMRADLPFSMTTSADSSGRASAR
jgi:GNAT superfamily N-acetyltransferase